MTGQTSDKAGREALFARKLRKAQAEAGLSNRELAQQLEVSESLLAKWRRGDSRPEIRNALKLAEALEHPVEWFFDDHDEAPVAA